MTSLSTLTSVVDLPSLHDPIVIVIGYAGRDLDAVRHHIDELAAIGVAPPPEVPMLYPMPAEVLERRDSILVSGEGTSGEVEPVLVRTGGQWYLTLGSDHTDRDLEVEDVLHSKQVCGKPIAARAVALDDVAADGGADALWETGHMQSWVDGTLYQSGSLASLRPASDLIGRVSNELNVSRDLVIFGGTVPLLDGVFRPGADFMATLTLPGLDPLELHYTTAITAKENNHDEV